VSAPAPAPELVLGPGLAALGASRATRQPASRPATLAVHRLARLASREGLLLVPPGPPGASGASRIHQVPP
jgi:hypothetical protein